MSRIFRSTTALTAALGLLAPSFAWAETVLPPKEFTQMQQRTAEGQPLLAAALANEIAAGLTADRLGCMDGAPRPCADGVALRTPMGLAVWQGEDGGIVLAPKKEQDRAVADAVGAATAGADPAARVLAQAEGEVIPPLPDGAGEEAAAEQAADKADAKSERAKRKAERAEARDAERAEARDKAAEPVPAEEDAAAERKNRNAEQPEAQDEAAEPVPAEEDAAAERKNRNAGQPEAQDEAAEPVPAGDSRAERAQSRSEGSDSRDEQAEPVAVEAGGEDTPSADALAEALAREGEPEERPTEGRAPESDDAPAVAREPDAEAPAVAREPGAAGEREERRQRAEPAPVPAEDAPDTSARATEIPPAAEAPSADELATALGKAEGEAPEPKVADSAEAVTAATGQKEAPKPVEVTADEQQALTDALAKADSAREARRAERRAERDEARQERQETQDSATPVAPGEDDAAAAAAASVQALTAPPRVSEDARTVVVTEGSARSSTEDFATSIADAIEAARKREAADAANDGRPVVAAPGTGSDEGRQEARDDDDDDNTLRNVLLAGLGAYAVGTILANQNRVALNTGDRVVLEAPDGSRQLLKDDNALLFQPGAQVTTENFSDGSSRSIVTREDGSRVVTIRDAQLRVLRRTLIAADGTTTELINDAEPVAPVEVAALPPPARPLAVSPTDVSSEELRRALEQEAAISRRFSLSQIRDISEVRSLVAPISIDSITFDTGSAAIRPSQAQQLSTLGSTIADMIRQNPAEVFLIEGYTDTVGSADMNLALSDRRAESLALALTEYFQVPPENMVVQGYGERFLKVPQEGDIRENRRVAVRRITDLLQN